MKFYKKDLKQFFYWINERHLIYLRKHTPTKFNNKKLKYAYTNDAILATYHFCNVFRELDRVTMWIKKHWRDPHKNHKNLLFAMAMARQINRPSTLAVLGFPKIWNAQAVRRKLLAIERSGQPVYTGAYLTVAAFGGRKIDQTIDRILTPLYKNPIVVPKGATLQGVAEELATRPGFSGFMAYETVSDLRHTPLLNKAPDIMTWANPGPGANRGLNRLCGAELKDINRRVRKEDAVAGMQQLLELSRQGNLGAHVPQLEMRDIEHSLCEYDKYERMRKGQGSMRRKYKPFTE